MARRTLIVAGPRDPTTGAVLTVRLGGGGAAPLRHGDLDYRAGVVRSPRFSARLAFDEDGWTGGTLPTTGAIVFSPAEASLLSQLGSLYWKGAAISVQVGPEAGPFAQRLTGKVADASVASGRLVLTIADLSAGIDQPLVTARFAGSGGVEGIAEATGRLKRRSWGRVFNVEGRILDKANGIYEFGDPARPVLAFDALRDKGSAGPLIGLAWQGSIAATFAALQAAAAPAGGGVVAPSIACAKWWTQPAGPLTADLRGEVGAYYVEDVVSIAYRVLAAVGGPGIANEGTAAAWRPAAAGLHLADENETTAQALDRLCLGASLLWVLDPSGSIVMRQISFAAPVETLRAIVTSRQGQIRPIRSRRVGYQRNQRQHGDGEIAAVLRGSDVAYADGTVIDALKPQEAAANITETRTSSAIAGQGSLATQNAANWSSQVQGSGKPADNATVGAAFGTNLLETSGGSVALLTAFKTILGQAASISGQGVFATLNSASVDNAALFTLPARLAPNPIHGAGYLDARLVAWQGGDVVQSFKPQEAGANVTEARTSAAIAGQGAFATINSVGYGSSFLTGFGPMAALDRARLMAGSGGIADETNSYWVTNSLAITSLGTASAIAGQGTLATLSAVTWSTQVTGAGKPENNATVGAIAGVNMLDAIAGALLTLAMIKTSLGTAAAIAGQGSLATSNTVDYNTQVTGKPSGTNKVTRSFAAAPSASVELVVSAGASVPLEFSWRGENYSVGGDRTGRIRVRPSGVGSFADALVGTPTYVGPDGPGLDQASGTWTNDTGSKQAFEFRFEMVGSAVTYTPQAQNFISVG